MDSDKIKGTAVLITEGFLECPNGKTAHGLIRGSERFSILGIIDKDHAGKDAGEVLDGKTRNIPIYSTLEELLSSGIEKPDYIIVGVALHGGVLPGSYKEILLEAIKNGISAVNGSWKFLCDDPVLSEAAKKYNVKLIDVRRPRPLNQLKFWSGVILSQKTPVIASLGIDCASGKRTTGRHIMESCRAHEIKAEMIYTGQTGWMQGYKHGFIFDATLNDFIGGEIERVIMECIEEDVPDLIIIEGQASLRNPSGPCGSEFILCGNAKGVILQHTPFRKYFEGFEHLHFPLPSIESEIELIRMLGAETLAVTLNAEGGTEEQLKEYAKKMTEKLKIPFVCPLSEGVDSLIPVIKKYIAVSY